MMTDRNGGRTKDDAQAQFLRLFLPSERELFRYVAALVPNVADAEEIVQQTAVELWKKFDQYDAQQPFTPWACRFALNIVKQWMASRQRWQAILERGTRLIAAGYDVAQADVAVQHQCVCDGCAKSTALRNQRNGSGQKSLRNRRCEEGRFAEDVQDSVAVRTADQKSALA